VSLISPSRALKSLPVGCSHERTPIDEALNSMRCDDILAIINAHSQSSSDGAGDRNDGGFDFDDAADEGSGSSFPKKPV
jgi:hypothetical protein